MIRALKERLSAPPARRSRMAEKTAKEGETFANVSVVDGEVHMHFPLSNSFLRTDAKNARQLADIIYKYADEAEGKPTTPAKPDAEGGK